MSWLEQLARRAAKATPGPWHWDSDPVKGDPTGRVRYQVTTIGKTITRIYYSSYEGGPTNAGDDAAYIAACSPERIAALVRVAEAAKLQQAVDPFSTIAGLSMELRALEATP